MRFRRIKQVGLDVSGVFRRERQFSCPTPCASRDQQFATFNADAAVALLFFIFSILKIVFRKKNREIQSQSSISWSAGFQFHLRYRDLFQSKRKHCQQFTSQPTESNTHTQNVRLGESAKVWQSSASFLELSPTQPWQFGSKF